MLSRNKDWRHVDLEPQTLGFPLKDELDKDASALWHKFRTWSVRYPKLG